MTAPDQPIRNHAAFIWSVADLLRGDYKQSKYGRVVLPLVVLRRLDCVLESTKANVLDAVAKYADKVAQIDPLLRKASGQQFYNTSPLTMATLLDDPQNLADNLHDYLRAFSPGAADVLEKFDLPGQIDRLDRADLLYLVVSRFCEIDLHPEAVSNLEMGYLYEELVRRFSELSNETAGEHFTPREVIRLMVNLLFIADDDLLTRPGIIKTLADPACGTGGMVSVAQDELRDLNPQGRLEVFGQELNPETYAICRSDMMLKGQHASHIVFGNSFSDDGLAGRTFDYLLANPPFGVEWKKVERAVRDEASGQGYAGRFGAGLPRINDGSFLFLQHMISKMKPVEQGGSRLAIVFNGSPLFTGAAGSGESEIRRWIIENDWLEAVVALPDQLFYNTGISTYFWIVTNRKAPERRGLVQLVDAREMFTRCARAWERSASRSATSRSPRSPASTAISARASGSRSCPRGLRLPPGDGRAAAAAALGGRRRLVRGREECAGSARRHRAQRCVTPGLAQGGCGPGPRGADRDQARGSARAGSRPPRPGERRPPRRRPGALGGRRLATDEYVDAVEHHLDAEVRPYVPDAWIDHAKTRIGYEIPLTRHFYRYVPPRPLAEIDAEIRALEAEIQGLLAEVTE